jgi:hypothetical protein
MPLRHSQLAPCSFQYISSPPCRLLRRVTSLAKKVVNPIRREAMPLKNPTEPRRMKMNLTVAAMGRMITQSTLASVAWLRTISGGTHLFEGGVQASATAAAGVISDATTSAALMSSTNCLARQQPPALLPSRPKPRSNPHQLEGTVVFDKEAHTIDATLSRLRQGGALAMSKRNRRAR